jgi:hypothetical protein
MLMSHEKYLHTTLNGIFFPNFSSFHDFLTQLIHSFFFLL